MENAARRRIAYVVGSLAKSKSNVGAIYDYQDGTHYSMSGRVDNGSVSIFDYTTSSHLSGTGSNGRYNLYDYSLGAHISLEYRSGKFSGYDFGKSCHFNGSVDGRGAVSIYDYGTSQYYSYTL